MQAAEIKDIGDWVAFGVERGWCSEPVCETHDGLPGTPEEADQWEQGFDPCVPAVRLYEQ